MMDGPCASTPLSVHIILAVGQVVQLSLTTWLAHRRRTADRERRRFFREMRKKHDIPLSAHEISEWIEEKRDRN